MSTPTKAELLAELAALKTETQELQRTRADASLRESEERYRRISAAVTDYIYTVRVEGTRAVATLHGPGCVVITGYGSEDFAADPDLWIRMVNEADREAVREQARQVLRGEDVPPLEHRITRKDGAERWVRSTVVPHRDATGRLLFYDGLIQDVTERKLVEEVLRARTRQLDTVRAIGQEITGELDLRALLDLIIERATELVGAQAGAILLWDETAGVLTPEASHGFGEWQKLVRLRLGEGLVGMVAQRRAGMVINDYREWAHAIPMTLTQSRITAAVAEPLLYQDRLLGVIALSNEGGRKVFTEQDRETLTLFVAQAAIAIQNARLYAAAVRRSSELEALVAATRSVTSGLDLREILDRILAEAARISGAPHVKVLLLDKDAGVLRVGALKGSSMPPGYALPVGVGSSGLVAQTGKPLFMADAQNDPRSIFAEGDREHGIVTYLGLPIKRADEVLGVLTFNTTVPHDYTPDEIAYLTSFADQAAIAIENARLYEAGQRELDERARAEAALLVHTRRLEAVRAVSAEIARELDLRALADLITWRAAELVGATSGVLCLWDDVMEALAPLGRFGLGGQHEAPSLRLGEGVAGVVAQRREGLIVNDFRHSPYATPQLLDVTTHTAVLGEALVHGDRLVGVITINRDAPPPFTEEDRQLLGLFAGQAAIAIENARLHGAAVRRGQELESLLRATRTVMSEVDLQRILDRIVTEAAEITHCAHVKLLLVDHGSQILRVGALKGTVLPQDFRMPLGVGLSGRVAVTGEPLFVVDPASDPHNILAEQDWASGVSTYLGLPIKSRGRVLGVLTFNTTNRRSYGADELTFLGSFADHAAIAIEKAQLFQELNQSYADLQRAQDELIRAEKLRALGQMSAGIAHDLNNMLAAILGQVELLRLRARDPEVQDALRMLETAATDGAQVVRRLQDFARQRGRSPLAPVNLADIVTESLEITRPRWRDELQRQGLVIDIQVRLGDIPLILGYGPEVREILTNLILNAVDAMAQGGTLRFAARAVATLADRSAEGDLQAQLPLLEYPAWVELQVTDTGVGMSDEVRKRVFDPFFTTKGGRGTGLGLSVVYGIMERHGGRIAVGSTPGHGTTVTLHFQAARAVPERGATPTPRSAVVPKRILLVDDDTMVRRTLGSLLRAAGHQVTEADGGAAGIALLEKAAIDLVLTDLGMPEVTGWDVASAARVRLPQVPIVLLTGWGEHGAAETPTPGLVDRVLGKPVRLEDLLGVIGELTAIE